MPEGALRNAIQKSGFKLKNLSYVTIDILLKYCLYIIINLSIYKPNTFEHLLHQSSSFDRLTFLHRLHSS